MRLWFLTVAFSCCTFRYIFLSFVYYVSGEFINPLYTGKLFHGYMLEESICYFMDVGSVFVAYSLFLMENSVSNVACEFGLHCLPMTI